MCHYCRPSTSGAAVSKSLKSRSHSNAVVRPRSSAQGHPHSKPSTSQHKSRVPKSGLVIPQVDPIQIDIDATVQRLERHLDDIDTSAGGGEGDVGGYHGDDILPEAAEDMGPGTSYVYCNCFVTHVYSLHINFNSIQCTAVPQ